MAALTPVPIINSNTSPVEEGNNGVLPGFIKDIDASAYFNGAIWIFTDSGTRDGLDVIFRVPPRYFDSAFLKVAWFANLSSSLSVVFDWELMARIAGEDVGAVADRDTETVTDASSGTAYQLEVASISLTDADYTAGDWIFGKLFRSSDLAADDAAVDIGVIGGWFESEDNA